VKDPEGDGIVSNVGDGPNPGHREGIDGNREQDEMSSSKD